MRFILIVLCFLPCLLVSQSDYKHERNKEALKVCNEIKASTLLVRIEDYHNDKMEYEAAGNVEYVEYLQNTAKEIETRLKEGFKKEYNYSNYVFFYAKDISKVLQGELQDFYDLEGNPIKLKADNYPKYIAFFSRNSWMVQSSDMVMHIGKRDNGKLEKIPEPFISTFSRSQNFFENLFWSKPKYKVRSMNESLHFQLKDFNWKVNRKNN